MKIKVYDRHAEHVDPDVPLCDHEEFRVAVGSSVTVRTDFSAPGWLWTSKVLDVHGEVEVHVEKGGVTLIVNQPDYLAARRFREA